MKDMMNSIPGKRKEENRMNNLLIATGHYIEVSGHNKSGNPYEVIILINEPNDVDNEKLIQATTIIEEMIGDKNRTEAPWNDISIKLDTIFPYGTDFEFRR